EPFPAEELDAYLGAFSQLSLWLGLVPLSLWYLYFGQSWEYPPYALVLASATIVLLGWGFFHMKNKGFTEAARFGVALVSGGIGFLGYFAPDVIGKLAQHVYSPHAIYSVAYYVLLALLSFILAAVLKSE
ncbi:MAG TPA: hypothetical protein VMT29_03870, partial [Steroidobacteraceae bacterium]|nr:hypothetical protein [Steroidobacteraceae bacterium]